MEAAGLRSSVKLFARLRQTQPYKASSTVRAATLPFSASAVPARCRPLCAAAESFVTPAEEADLTPAWLAVRHTVLPASRSRQVLPGAGTEIGDTQASSSTAPALANARLDSAAAGELVSEALRLAQQGASADDEHWQALVARLCKVELNATEAIVVLHSMDRLGCHNAELLKCVVDRIECRYFSMELGLNDHEALELFDHDGCFQSLLNNLPLSHKVKLILVDCTTRPESTSHRRPAREAQPDPDPKKAWKTADPVEMEEWEREQFAKGRLRIKRMRNVQARVKRMAPGKRLRATLAAQLMQVLHKADVSVLAEVSQVCAFPFAAPRLLHGDLQSDFHETLARRVASLDRNAILPYIVAFASALRNFEGPEAFRAWRRKMIPAVRSMLKSRNLFAILEGQLLVHPRLGGIAQPNCLPSSEPALRQRVQAEMAARLLVAFAGARQMAMDVQLFDELSAPLEELLERWLSRAASEQGPLLCLETISDLFGSCIACGVTGSRLPEQLANLIMQQYCIDGSVGFEALKMCSMTDICTVAHGVSVLCKKPEAPLSRIWAAAEPRLHEAPPHLALMLLSTILRGGSEELLTLPTLVQAVDELLVQRLDFDTKALGHIAC
eukprot:TRINITY_DN45698_c0_g1_i1.p1 TRINITY_DN45698_c0_g1~~TRINITY_DN45698_c0_g1_i1.p1  ORF type:complete len:628 (+),score=117.98 TRINITY_DN45698_c0_g1_i1:45-1886(+)